MSPRRKFERDAITTTKATEQQVSIDNDNTPQTVVVTGLTVFKESSADLQTDDCAMYKGRPISNPFHVADYSSLTKRAFLIKSFTWTNATTVQTVPLLGELLLSTGVATLLKLYRLIRCCIKVDIKMISTPYHQGSLLAGWLPCVTAPPLDRQSLSAYHGIVLSASKQDSCSFTIPYCSPQDWMDTTAITNTSGEHASVFIMPLNTLLTTSPQIAASIPVEVWGTIEDCDLSGFQSQSSKNSGNLDSNGLTAAQRKMKEQDEEAAAKARAGKDAQVGSVIRNTSQLVRKIPIVGEVWSPVADVINLIFGTELDKPLSTASNMPMIPQYYNDTNHAVGLNDAVSLSLYQHPKLSVSQVMFGMDTSFKSFKQFVSKPMLFDVVTFDGTTTVWTTVPLPNVVGSTLTKADYLCTANTMFRFWRGSIKYAVYFCLPAFYSFRARIRLQYNSTVVDVGNVPSMQIDVKGDTWIKFTVPFLSSGTWRENAGSQPVLPHLYIEQLSTIVGAPSPSLAVAYVNIFRSGGEDTQFACLREPKQSAIRSKVVRRDEDLSCFHKQCSINELFSKTFEGITPGQSMSQEVKMTMSEVVDSVNDVFKRAQQYTIGSVTIGGDAAITPHRILASAFMWWRGSRVFRHMHIGNTSMNQDGWYLNLATSSTNKIDWGWAPAYETATAVRMPEAISVPWYCAVPYIVTPGVGSAYISGFHQQYAPIHPILALGTADILALSAGDDYEMMFQVPWANQIVFPEEETSKGSKKSSSSSSSSSKT